MLVILYCIMNMDDTLKFSRVFCFWVLWFVLGFFSVSILNARNYKRKLTKITAINYFSFRQSRGFLATLIFFSFISFSSLFSLSLYDVPLFVLLPLYSYSFLPLHLFLLSICFAEQVAEQVI